MKTAVVDEARCVGCRLCELACSFGRRGVFDPEAAAICVTFLDDGRVAVTVSDACSGCRLALCAEFCPVDAIRVSED